MENVTDSPPPAAPPSPLGDPSQTNMHMLPLR